MEDIKSTTINFYVWFILKFDHKMQQESNKLFTYEYIILA